MKKLISLIAIALVIAACEDAMDDDDRRHVTGIRPSRGNGCHTVNWIDSNRWINCNGDTVTIH